MAEGKVVYQLEIDDKYYYEYNKFIGGYIEEKFSKFLLNLDDYKDKTVTINNLLHLYNNKENIGNFDEISNILNSEEYDVTTKLKNLLLYIINNNCDNILFKILIELHNRGLLGLIKCYINDRNSYIKYLSHYFNIDDDCYNIYNYLDRAKTIFNDYCKKDLEEFINEYLLKENKGEKQEDEKHVTVKEAFSYSFKNKSFIYWMVTCFIMTIGLQLFLGGINEVFSSTGLNMTIVMASSFAPVPLTIMAYNKLCKKKGLGFAYRFILTVFCIGMSVLLFCYFNPFKLDDTGLNIIAVLGGIFISMSIGAFFSITYIVPTRLAQMEYEATGKTVSAMYFAVQGIFEGIAAGVATGLILVQLKDFNVIWLLPIISIVACMIAFVILFTISLHFYLLIVYIYTFMVQFE